MLGAYCLYYTNFSILGRSGNIFASVTLSFLFSESKKGNVVLDKGKAGNRRIVSGFESM
jgi:hypothetical protein